MFTNPCSTKEQGEYNLRRNTVIMRKNFADKTEYIKTISGSSPIFALSNQYTWPNLNWCDSLFNLIIWLHIKKCYVQTFFLCINVLRLIFEKINFVKSY
jgi:hypothetical protein